MAQLGRSGGEALRLLRGDVEAGHFEYFEVLPPPATTSLVVKVRTTPQATPVRLYARREALPVFCQSILGARLSCIDAYDFADDVFVEEEATSGDGWTRQLLITRDSG